MDRLREFLDDLKRRGLAEGNFVGLLNLVMGRRIQKPDGSLISQGVTWRELAELLRRMRWDKDVVRELGLDPDTLPPRDRQRYWYLAIVHARVDSAEATARGDTLAEAVRGAGYEVGPAPGTRS
jgi:hypothetical protein